MEREKRLLLISHCVINQNSVVKPLARARGAFPIVKSLIDDGIGIIQLPCPELKHLGINRDGMTKNQYDTPEFRKLSKKLLEPILEEVVHYLSNGYTLLGVLGINQSPSCSITGNRGVFMEELFSMLDEAQIPVNYFEIPTDYNENSDYDSLYHKLKMSLKF